MFKTSKELIPSQWTQTARKQQQFTALIRNAFPSPMNEHLWFGGLHNNLLTLVVDDASWATPIRFHQNQALFELKKSPKFSEAKSIKVHVDPQLKNILKVGSLSS